MVVAYHYYSQHSSVLLYDCGIPQFHPSLGLWHNFITVSTDLSKLKNVVYHYYSEHSSVQPYDCVIPLLQWAHFWSALWLWYTIITVSTFLINLMIVAYHYYSKQFIPNIQMWYTIVESTVPSNLTNVVYHYYSEHITIQPYKCGTPLLQWAQFFAHIYYGEHSFVLHHTCIMVSTESHTVQNSLLLTELF